MAKVPTPLRELKNRTPDDVKRIRSQQIRQMASTDSDIKAMAALIGITPTELRKHHRKDIKNGHAHVYAAISARLVGAAIGGDIRAMLAWMRQFGGWQEVSRREVTGRNGEPISFRSLDASSLTAVLEALSQKGTAGAGAGRNGPQIELRSSDVVDLDPLPGSSDEGAEE